MSTLNDAKMPSLKDKHLALESEKVREELEKKEDKKREKLLKAKK